MNKSSARFKIGDRIVVVYKADSYMDDKYLNKVGTIIDTGDSVYDWRVQFEEDIFDAFFESELELEHLYNSPLMKALR